MVPTFFPSSLLFFIDMHPLSDDLVQTILAHLQQGKSIKKTADIAAVSTSTVHFLRWKHLPELSSHRRGRPVKLSAQDKRFCVRAITAGHSKGAVIVQKKLEHELDVKVSERTVRRTLEDAGLKAAEKQKKPRLSAKNIKARLDFAYRHKDWTVEDWKRVV